MDSPAQVSSNEDTCSCDETIDGNSSSVDAIAPLELTLENFDSDEIPDDCPFVLTSPRSLEACKIVGVRVSYEFFRITEKRQVNVIFS